MIDYLHLNDNFSFIFNFQIATAYFFIKTAYIYLFLIYALINQVHVSTLPGSVLDA